MIVKSYRSQVLFFGTDPENKLIAHNAIWGYPPIQKQNKISKKLSEKSLSRYKKFGQANSNGKEKKDILLI